MRQNNLRFPRRRGGELHWEAPSRARVYSVLTNPQYTGTYVYGRVRILPGREGARRAIAPRDESEWISTAHHHEGYVTAEDWYVINRVMTSRRPALQPIVGKGRALLQGLLRCGQCARRFQTKYWAKDRQVRSGSYLCRPLDEEGQPLHTVTCSARPLDQVVVDKVLSVLTPIEMDAALAAIADAGQERKAIARVQARQLQDADDDVDRAWRSYERAGSDHPRVSADLLQKYEDALAHRDELKRPQTRTAMPEPVSVTTDDAAELRALTADMQRLWHADTTTNEDRKRLLRTVLSKVTVRAVTAEAVDLELVWAGGLREPIKALRPKGVDGLVEQLRKSGRSPMAIAAELHAAGIASAKGTAMRREAIYGALSRLGLRRKDHKIQVLLRIRELLLQNCPRSQILDTIRTEAPSSLGPWSRQRLNQAVSALYRGSHGIPPVPKPLKPARETPSPGVS